MRLTRVLYTNSSDELPTCHGHRQAALSLQHLMVAALTARSKARYGILIENSDFLCPKCIQHPVMGPRRNITIRLGTEN